jgi:aspartate kinase
MSSSKWVVLKFGGTSVATAARWQNIIAEMKRCERNGERPCVVVSAITTITNRMSHCVEEALHNISPKKEGSAFQGVCDVHIKLIKDLGLLEIAQDTTNPNSIFIKEGIDAVHALLDDLEQLLNGVRLTREETDPQASPRICARISAFGELLSSQIGLLAIRSAGISCARLDARRLLKSTENGIQQEEDKYLVANVEPSSNVEMVRNQLEQICNKMGVKAAPHGYAAHCAVITQGFIASTPRGATCLLGRGGSDTSAALFAALLQANRLEIWTDVHGLFTSDPRHVENTRLIREVSYRVAQELASMGAKVLHPRCLVPAAWAGIPVEIHNTNDPTGPYSKIVNSDSTPTSLELQHEVQEIQNSSLEGNPSPPLSPNRTINTSSNNGSPPTLKLATGDSCVMAITCRSGQVLLNITNMNMWGEAGFLSRVFAPFGELDVSVDLVATSQYAVSLTLDHIPGGVHGDVFLRLLGRLRKLGAVSTREPCAVVSIVGERLRNALPELGAALEELRKREVHLMTQSSEDLNLSFVVDEGQAKSLVSGLHSRLFPKILEGAKDSMSNSVIRYSSLGETWEALKNRNNKKQEYCNNSSTENKTSGAETTSIPRVPSSFLPLSSLDTEVQGNSDATKKNTIKINSYKRNNNNNKSNVQWWKAPSAVSHLLQLTKDDSSEKSSYYVYDTFTVRQRCLELSNILLTPRDENSVQCLTGGLLYAMKANPHPELLRLISQSDDKTRQFGIECVSIEEVRMARRILGNSNDAVDGGGKNNRIQFTPNFCHVSEYAEAFRVGATVVVDNIEILKLYPEIFSGRNIGLRVDPHHHENISHGHHKHVRTSGGKQKFGMPIAEAAQAAQDAQKKFGVTVTGIHVHVGSGVMNPSVWLETAKKICSLILNLTNDDKVSHCVVFLVKILFLR